MGGVRTIPGKRKKYHNNTDLQQTRSPRLAAQPTSRSEGTARCSSRLVLPEASTPRPSRPASRPLLPPSHAPHHIPHIEKAKRLASFPATRRGVSERSPPVGSSPHSRPAICAAWGATTAAPPRPPLLARSDPRPRGVAAQGHGGGGARGDSCPAAVASQSREGLNPRSSASE